MGQDQELRWTASVPAPEAIVILEEGRYRAELINFIQKGDRVKDIRVRGPIRTLRKEALKDAAELRRAAHKGGHDPSLFHVRARRKDLESVRWTQKDLADVEDKEEDERQRRREEDEARQKKEDDAKQQKAAGNLSFEETVSRLMRQQEESFNKFKPVGPNWQKPGSMVALPKIKDHPNHPSAWKVHSKQDASGKYRAWLYFSMPTGKYYRPKDDSSDRFVLTGVPHDPREYPVTVHLGSASIPSRAGKKLDMAVLLPELTKTGFLLKQPLEFLDRPAALFLLCDGLRNTDAATSFCAKKFHSVLLPKLSARATEWEDFELVDIVRDAAEALDGLLLDSPAAFGGCGLAVALLVGTRLVLGALGGVRCVLCRPVGKSAGSGGGSSVTKMAASRSSSAPRWVPDLMVGGDAHTLENEDERLRVESLSGRLLYGGAELHSGSARPSAVTLPDERERLLTQVARAASPFATLGLVPADLKHGPAAIRRTFRKMSLLVHPDKVGESLRQRAVAAFAKLEAATTTVEAMLQVDASAAVVLAEVDAAFDEFRLASDPVAAAKFLGVDEGSGPKAVAAAGKKKYHGPLSKLQDVSRRDVERAIKIVEVAEECVARGTKLWQPSEAEAGVRMTRALGCKDLKVPAPLVSAGLVAECVEIEPGSTVGVALLSDGCASLSEAEVATLMARHAPHGASSVGTGSVTRGDVTSLAARPRAAALRIALDGSAKDQDGLAAGAVCAFFERAADGVGEAISSSAGTQPALKRQRTAKPERVRVSHILLRWAGLKGEDEFARPGLDPPTRKQVDAERELLELCELLSSGDSRTLGSRFKSEVMKRSECASALNVPYADLGWIEQGGAEPSLEAAAFNAPVGCLSDVVVSSRGAHLMYRMA
eukprot:TRINITY_DN54681_c0_g1_i1.p1 TRINITY_DN54681_c0_g1~~TRINITY_DN54681_c0_g1_i1.p1  ORF type:complete len:884 (+),score=186.44 TRINITY_DN54681_c0_g1_i1:76-2727(+)